MTITLFKKDGTHVSIKPFNGPQSRLEKEKAAKLAVLKSCCDLVIYDEAPAKVFETPIADPIISSIDQTMSEAQRLGKAIMVLHYNNFDAMTFIATEKDRYQPKRDGVDFGLAFFDAKDAEAKELIQATTSWLSYAENDWLFEVNDQNGDALLSETFPGEDKAIDAVKKNFPEFHLYRDELAKLNAKQDSELKETVIAMLATLRCNLAWDLEPFDFEKLAKYSNATLQEQEAYEKDFLNSLIETGFSQSYIEEIYVKSDVYREIGERFSEGESEIVVKEAKELLYFVNLVETFKVVFSNVEGWDYISL